MGLDLCTHYSNACAYEGTKHRYVYDVQNSVADLPLGRRSLIAGPQVNMSLIRSCGSCFNCLRRVCSVAFSFRRGVGGFVFQKARTKTEGPLQVMVSQQNIMLLQDTPNVAFVFFN